MSEITDKELLAICNLTNLKLEFANLETVDDVTKKLSNHTISSLFKAEYDGINKRLALGIYKTAIRKKMNLNDGTVTTGTDDNADKADKIQKEINEYHTKYWDFQKNNKSEKLGAFYRDYAKESDEIASEKNGGFERQYQYYTGEEFRKAAPIAIEYYDRLIVSDDPFHNAGEFLKEWEIVYAADDYKIGYDRIKLFYERLVDSSDKIINKNIDELMKGVPSREEIESSTNIAYTINGLIILTEWIGHMETAFGIFKLNHLAAAFTKSEKVIEILNALGWNKYTTDGVSLALSVTNKEVFQKKIKPLLDNEIKENNSINNITQIPLDEKINLENRGIRVVIAKKNDKIIIAIKKNNAIKKNESINKMLNNGVLPEEVLYLHDLISDKLSSYNIDNKNIILTGYGEGGKIAAILSIINNVEAKCFYDTYPTNLGTIVDFLPNDTALIAGEYAYTENKLKKVVWDFAKNTVAALIGGRKFLTKSKSILVTATIIRILKMGATYRNLVLLNNRWVIYFDKLEFNKILKNLKYFEMDKKKYENGEIGGEVLESSESIEFFTSAETDENSIIIDSINIAAVDLDNFKIEKIKGKVNKIVPYHVDRNSHIKITLLQDILEYEIYYGNKDYLVFLKRSNSSEIGDEYVIFKISGNTIIEELYAKNVKYNSQLFGRINDYVEKAIIINILKRLVSKSKNEDIGIAGISYYLYRDTKNPSFSVEMNNIKNSVIVNFDLSSNDPLNFCYSFLILLDYFKLIQTNFNNKKNAKESIGHYFPVGGSHPISATLTLYIKEDEDNAKNEMIHFPYIGDNGWIKQEINGNFIASVLKRVFSSKNEKLKWELWEGDGEFGK
jgi:hypothetical protein